MGAEAALAQKACIIFRWRSTNWYSLPPLISSLNQLTNSIPVLDIMLEKEISENRASELIKSYDLVFFLDSFLSPQAKNISIEMKDRSKFPFSRFIYIAGGAHASGDPMGTLNMGFDYVVVGEGEITLVELLNTLCIGQKPEIIPEGVARSTDNDKLDFKPRKRRVNLDDYQPFATRPKNLHPPVEIARGCPFACRFCQVSYLFGYRPRYRSIDAINRIIKHYCAQFKDDIQFRLIAPNFLGYGSKTGRKLNLRALKELLAVIKSNNVTLFAGTFPSTVRPEFLNEDTAKLLSENVANRRISMGVQSGSPKILADICHRGHSLDAVIQAHENLEKVGLNSEPDFILGIPGETTNDQWETLDFLRFLIDNFDAKPRLHHFMPLPGTPLASKKPSPIDREVWIRICQLTTKKLALGHFGKQSNLARDML